MARKTNRQKKYESDNAKDQALLAKLEAAIDITVTPHALARLAGALDTVHKRLALRQAEYYGPDASRPGDPAGKTERDADGFSLRAPDGVPFSSRGGFSLPDNGRGGPGNGFPPLPILGAETKA